METILSILNIVILQIVTNSAQITISNIRSHSLALEWCIYI